MGELLQIFRFAGQNFIKWRRNPRIFITFLLAFVLGLMLSDEILFYAQKYEVSIQVLEPFIWTYGDQTSVMLSSLLLLLLFADMPFVDQETPYQLIRTRRSTWLAGQVVYVITATILYQLFLLTVQMIFASPMAFVGNVWSKTAAMLGYVSSKKSYAMELFESHPLNFLVKPLDEEKFLRIFQKAVTLIDQSEKIFCYKKGHAQHKIFLSEILYFEANNREITIHMCDETEVFYGALKNIYQELEGKGFFFCHKAFLVQYDKVKVFETNQLKMQNGDVLPISQGKRRMVKEIQLKREARYL